MRGSTVTTRVQRTVGLDSSAALATLRLSFGRWATPSDVDGAAALLASSAAAGPAAAGPATAGAP